MRGRGVSVPAFARTTSHEDPGEGTGRSARHANDFFESSARRHFGADFGAQLVDQLEALVGLDVPEGPAVAGARALRYRADAVDRADLVAEHDGAVGADQSAVTLLGIDQFA